MAVLNNMDVSFGLFVIGPLACMLLYGVLVALARVHRLGRLGRLVPDSLLQLGVRVIALGLLLRSLAGIVWVTGLGTDPGATFY